VERVIEGHAYIVQAKPRLELPRGAACCHIMRSTSCVPSSVIDMARRNLGWSVSEVRLLTSYAPSSETDMARRNLGWSFSEVRAATS
jgi:hypothetical protein